MCIRDSVGKTYPNGVRALDGLSLAVAPGEILVTIGGSGCGVYEEIACDLPRPRDRQSAAFDFVKRRVLAALDRTLDRAVITDDGETRAAAGGGLWW